MEMQQLRYFLAVAKTGNFSRAAVLCRVAQPSLSQQIQKLEAELEESLFERSRPTAHLTLAGERFLPRAGRILAEADAAIRESHAKQDLTVGKLIVGVLPTIAPYLLPRMIQAFKARHPGVEVIVHEETTAVLLEQLADREIEIGLASLPLGDERFATRKLFDEELLLAIPLAHRLARKRTVTMEDLEQIPFILLKQGHCLGDQILRFCAKQDLRPSVSCRSAQLQTIQGLVEAGLGVSLIPKMAVPKMRESKTRRQAIYRSLQKPRPFRTIAAVWLKNRPQSRAVMEFLSILEDLPKENARNK